MEKIGVKKLNDVNYSDWKFEVELLLVREKLWKFVDPGQRPAVRPGTATVQGNEADLAEWDDGDKRARATIGLLVESTQYSLIKKTKTAKEAWESIRGAHEKQGRTSKTTILRKVMRMEYVDGEDIGAYVSQMEDHFEKLAIAGQELDKDLKVNIVLSSLPDSFSTLITALEGRPDTDLTMEFVRGKLVDEVARRRSSSGLESALRTEFRKKPVLCHFCQKPGHKRKECRQWMEQQKAEESVKNIPKQRSRQKAKVAEESSGEFAFSSRTDTADVTKNVNTPWIIDSGASCHMCNDQSKFLKIDSSVIVEVTLADGKQIKSKGVGTCVMETFDKNGAKKSLKLSETLFMPDLEVNLMSVLKLTSKGGKVIFENNECTIEKGGFVAATATARGGLYYVNNIHIEVQAMNV